MVVRKASHFGLCVSDLERAIAFYCDALGFEEISRTTFDNEMTRQLLGLPEGVLEAAYLKRDGWLLELLHFPKPETIPGEAPRPMNRTGLTHLSFVVESLNDAIAAVERCGGRILEETRLATVVFVLDPDGTRLELMTNDFDPEVFAAELN